MGKLNSILLLGFVSLLSTIGGAQSRYPVDPPRGAIVPNTPARNERNLEDRMADMRTLEARMRIRSQLDKMPTGPPRLTPAMVEHIKKRRRVEQTIFQTYSQFLKLDRTGIFRIFPYKDCFTANVVRIDAGCEDFVAESSGFSFRSKGYADRNYHDLFYENDRLSSFDFFSQGLFVVLGDVPIEAVDKTHAAFAALAGYDAHLSTDEAIQNARHFANGKVLAGYDVKDVLLPKAGSTYLFRHVAYKIGNSVPPLSKSSTLLQLKFLSLSFDERDDVIVVFKIANMDDDGALTIVWRELSREDAPKLKFPKGRPLTDLREVPTARPNGN